MSKLKIGDIIVRNPDNWFNLDKSITERFIVRGVGVMHNIDYCHIASLDTELEYSFCDMNRFKLFEDLKCYPDE